MPEMDVYRKHSIDKISTAFECRLFTLPFIYKYIGECKWQLHGYPPSYLVENAPCFHGNNAWTRLFVSLSPLSTLKHRSLISILKEKKILRFI